MNRLASVATNTIGNNLLSGTDSLAPLGYYGGLTPTRPPLPGSPAIDAGAPTGLTTDQRGLPRPSGAAPDLGAVEINHSETNAWSTPGIVRSIADDGFGSFRVALLLAEAGSTIAFDAAVDGQTLYLAHGPLRIPHDLTVDTSALVSGLTLSGNEASAILDVDQGATLSLAAVNFLDGKSTISGGAIRNQGNLTLEGCTIANSLSFVDGGGIWNGGTLELINATLSGNFAAEAGGGVYSVNSLTVRHSTLSGNEAFFESGGGIYNGSANLTLENSVVAGNEARIDPDLSGPLSTARGHNLLSGDPRLAPLADYGGRTLTRPPLPNSPVIERALLLSTTPPLDQLGNSRPAGPLPDLGAVEAVPLALALASALDSEPDGIPDLLEGALGPYPQLDPTVNDSTLDSDGDGQSDAMEIANMTDPLDANDVFRILSIRRVPAFDAETNPIVSVTISTFPGFNYAFETNDAPQHFQLFPGSSFTAGGYTATFELLLPNSSWFLRARRD